MFKIIILANKDQEIKVLGARELVSSLRDSLSPYINLINYTNYTEENNEQFSAQAEFILGINSLKTIIKGTSVAEIFLDVIRKNSEDISKINYYLFHYWALETKINQSNIDSKENLPLTSPQTLSYLFDQCKLKGITPPPKILLDFVQSKNLRDLDSASNRHASQEDIAQFIEKEQKRQASFLEVRKAARLLGEGFRTNSCIFSRLPPEINRFIASLNASDESHSQNEAVKIATSYFTKFPT